MEASEFSNCFPSPQLYTPYGEKQNQYANCSHQETNIGFTGHKHDSSSGLTYMQARYYDPLLGRFLSVDPVGFIESSPVSFNRYAYANNNPYKYVDPDGKLPSPRNIYNFGKNAGGLIVEEIVYVGAVVNGNPEVAQLALEGMSAKVGDAAASTIDMVSPKKGTGKAIVNAISKTKSVNLPSWKKIGIDIEHIASGHMKGGSRASSQKDLFPENMTKSQIEKSIREAYRYGKRIKTQDDRVLVRGKNVEMWVNTKTKTIETAYPVK